MASQAWKPINTAQSWRSNNWAIALWLSNNVIEILIFSFGKKLSTAENMNHIGDMENVGDVGLTPLDTLVMIKKSETTDLMDYEVTGNQGPG